MAVVIRCVLIQDERLTAIQEGVSGRAFSRMLKHAWTKVGQWWHRERRPLHFLPGARFQFKHRKRTKKHLLRKQKLVARGKLPPEAATTDNIFTGLMRESMETVFIRAFPTRVRLSYEMPSYANIRFKSGSNQPDKMGETFTLTDFERRTIKEMVIGDLEEQFQEMKGRGLVKQVLF